MTVINNKSAAFAVDCNVHIKVISPTGTVQQSVEKHNKASRQLVTGMLRFIQGHFTKSFRRGTSTLYADDAIKYIPCYVGLGSGGVVLDSEGFPIHEPEQPRIPLLTQDWSDVTHFVNYTDTKLDLEMSRNVSRVELGFVSDSVHNLAATGDCDMFTLSAEIPPGHYNKIYNGKTSPIYCTELGLFSGPTPNSDDLLAKVIITDPVKVLYIRPQDTVKLTWTISIIALGDSSEYIDVNSQEKPVNATMTSNIPLNIIN